MWFVWLYLPLYFTTSKIFGRILCDTRCVLIFCTTFVWIIYYSKKNSTIFIINVHMSSYKIPIILVMFQWNLKFARLIFEKSSNIKFHENPSTGSGVVAWYVQTRLIVDFRNFVNAPKISCLYMYSLFENKLFGNYTILHHPWISCCRLTRCCLEKCKILTRSIIKYPIKLLAGDITEEQMVCGARDGTIFVCHMVRIPDMPAGDIFKTGQLFAVEGRRGYSAFFEIYTHTISTLSSTLGLTVFRGP
jgi:hypothetical protein